MRTASRFIVRYKIKVNPCNCRFQLTQVIKGLNDDLRSFSRSFSLSLWLFRLNETKELCTVMLSNKLSKFLTAPFLLNPQNRFVACANDGGCDNGAENNFAFFRRYVHHCFEIECNVNTLAKLRQ